MHEHSSLFVDSVIDKRKMFYKISTWSFLPSLQQVAPSRRQYPVDEIIKNKWVNKIFINFLWEKFTKTFNSNNDIENGIVTVRRMPQFSTIWWLVEWQSVEWHSADWHSGEWQWHSRERYSTKLHSTEWKLAMGCRQNDAKERESSRLIHVAEWHSVEWHSREWHSEKNGQQNDNHNNERAEWHSEKWQCRMILSQMTLWRMTLRQMTV